MKKETFQKKWYYPLIKIIFWSSLIFFSSSIIIIGLYEDDIPLAGFLWAGIIILIYWLVKRIFYFVMFRENILPYKH